MRAFHLPTIVAAATLILFSAAAQEGRGKSTCPLSQALASSGISLDGWDAELLKTEVFLGLGKEVTGKDAIAFGAEVFGPPPSRALHVAVRDRKSGRWIDHPIDVLMNNGYMLNLRSIQDLRIGPSVVYVGTHVNPSWCNTAVVDSDWKLHCVMEGWIIGLLHDGSVVYQRGEPHIAPVHPLELSVFDPKILADRKIYPHTPFGLVRTAFNKDLQRPFDAIGQDWFQRNNHPGNTALITEVLSGAFLVQERGGDSLIICSTLDGSQFDPVHGTQDRSRDVNVIAVFRHVNDPAKLEYREFRAEALRQQVPFDQPQDLANPNMVKRIFALPYP